MSFPWELFPYAGRPSTASPGTLATEESWDRTIPEAPGGSRTIQEAPGGGRTIPETPGGFQKGRGYHFGGPGKLSGTNPGRQGTPYNCYFGTRNKHFSNSTARKPSQSSGNQFNRPETNSVARKPTQLPGNQLSYPETNSIARKLFGARKPTQLPGNQLNRPETPLCRGLIPLNCTYYIVH